MASDQRRTPANKVPIALPKPDAAQPSSAPVSQETGLQLSIGSRARITVGQPNPLTLEGFIYTADPITNLLVLNVSASSQPASISTSSLAAPPGSYRIIPVSQISSFQLLSLPQSTTNENPKSPDTVSSNALDMAGLTARLQRNTAAAQLAQSRQGPKGTSGLDQALFDGLSRSLPTRWEGTSIIISDSFVVEKPYDAKNVKLLPGAHGDVERVRKVVERQKTNAGLRQPINAGNGTIRSTGDSNRKGG